MTRNRHRAVCAEMNDQSGEMSEQKKKNFPLSLLFGLRGGAAFQALWYSSEDKIYWSVIPLVHRCTDVELSNHVRAERL